MNVVVKNKKSLAFITIITIAAAAFMGISISSCQKEETIKIGAIMTLSGPASHLVDLRDAILLAADEVNSRGGINGREIELIIEDSQTNPLEGILAFNRIEKTHDPVLYVSALSSVSTALAPLAEENEVVLVALVATATELTGQKEWVFRFWPTAETEVSPIMWILQDLKVKELGILYLNDEFGTSVSGLLKEEFEKIGGIVKRESFETMESGFKEQISNLRDMEAIYAVGLVKHVGKIFRKLREENYHGLILGPSGSAVHSIKTSPESNGAYLPAPIIYNPRFIFAKELKEKYETRYNKPLTHQAAVGYDFIIILADLLEDEEKSRESVKRVLEAGFIYSGVFGTLNVQPGEHDITFPLLPARIVDGEIKYLR